VITGIVFGLVPALKISRTNIGDTLKDSGRSVSGHRSRMQAVFVIGEMAMALVLLVGAGLMLRTLMRLWGLDPGFNPHNVVHFGVTPPPSLAQRSTDEIRAVLRQIDSTIRSVPGVENASLQSGAHPMEGDDEAGIWPEGQQLPARQADFASTLEYVVEPEYLKAMRIPLLRGRSFTDADNEHSERVVLIDSSFAKQYFPGQDPIGKHVKVLELDSDPTQSTWVSLVVVGVVGHVNQWGLAEDAARPLQAQLYLPFMQGTDVLMKNFAQGADVFVRFGSALNPEATFQTIQKKLAASDSDLIVGENESEEEVVARSIAGQRFSLILLGVFAGLALLLASIGIYGVLSYLVGQRTREIGVRMALGAQRLHVLRMVLHDGICMTLAGAAIGVVAAFGLTRLMASMLFGVKPTDPLTFIAVAVGLCGIALFACYIPARRAMRVDPMVALRYE
jgi:putative ABC transport system permease protein